MDNKNLKPHFSNAKPTLDKKPKNDPKAIQEMIEIIKRNRKIVEEWEAKRRALGINNECEI